MSEHTTESSPRSKNGKVKSTRTAARRPSAPKLGELEFSEWYETPMFEPSNEERIETMATGGRVPARLLARVVLGAEARRERRRAERQRNEPATEQVVERAAEPEPAPEPVIAAEPEPAPEPAVIAAEPEPVVTAAEPEQTLAAAPTEPPEPADPGHPGAATPAEPGPDLIPELAADRPGWRRKAGALLDRWAEKEVAVATKLDEALAPAIPWGGHKKAAHSRRNRSS